VSRPIASVIGAGPAGLRAAEVLAEGGCKVLVFEQKKSLGRKFLVAGRGGLNITHSEPLETFVTRYDSPSRWKKILSEFSPEALRRWYEHLGVPTFVGSSGRVFPRQMRASAILEKWLERLEELQVDIRTNHCFHQILGQRPFDLVFHRGDDFSLVSSDLVLFAVGGASWPQTGSDGKWAERFREMKLDIRDFVPSNVGWERSWTSGFLEKADGRPLKNVVVECGGRSVKGELMVTQYGLEGGALYQVSRELRQTSEITIDFKPDVPIEVLVGRCQQRPCQSLEELAVRVCRLSPTAWAFLTEVSAPRSVEDLIATIKRCRIRLCKPRPIGEAISSAGGLAWGELDDHFMLAKYPGIFCAGEMIDWEATTGGYLLQGCFATATLAAKGALRWIANR
jgi:uncharacterized flavoprotein (TIGR03862 family)